MLVLVLVLVLVLWSKEVEEIEEKRLLRLRRLAREDAMRSIQVSKKCAFLAVVVCM